MFDINQVELTEDQVNLWNNAVTLINCLKNKAIEFNALIWFDEMIVKPSDIIIDEFSIYVVYENSIFSIFEKDTSYDDGLYTPVDDFRDYVRENFKILQQIEFVC